MYTAAACAVNVAREKGKDGGQEQDERLLSFFSSSWLASQQPDRFFFLSK